MNRIEMPPIPTSEWAGSISNQSTSQFLTRSGFAVTDPLPPLPSRQTNTPGYLTERRFRFVKTRPTNLILSRSLPYQVLTPRAQDLSLLETNETNPNPNSPAPPTQLSVATEEENEKRWKLLQTVQIMDQASHWAKPRSMSASSVPASIENQPIMTQDEFDRTLSGIQEILMQHNTFGQANRSKENKQSQQQYQVLQPRPPREASRKHQATWPHPRSKSTGTNSLIRKKKEVSVRERLEYRIAELHNHKDLKEDFLHHVEQIRQERMKTAGGISIAKRNKDDIWKCSPEQAALLIQHKAKEREERICQTQQRRIEKETQEYNHKIALIRRREIREELEIKRREEEKAREILQQQQAVWLSLVSLSVGCNAMSQEMLKQRRTRDEERQRWRAVVIIQRFFRGKTFGQKSEVTRRNLDTVRHIMRTVLRMKRVGQMHRGADTIKMFLMDLQSYKSIVTVIKNYRFHVIQSQRFWRQWLEIRQARLLVLRMQWQKIEKQLIRDSTKENVSNAPVDALQSAMTDILDARRLRRLQEQQKRMPRVAAAILEQQHRQQQQRAAMVPPNIRDKILQDNLRERRKRFERDDLDLYQLELAEYKAKKQLEDARLMIMTNSGGVSELVPPQRPTFRCLLPHDEMVKLIKQGQVLMRKMEEDFLSQSANLAVFTQSPHFDPLTPNSRAKRE